MNIEAFRNRILSKDESNGYIERERAIEEFLAGGGGSLPQAQKYICALETVLGILSTPVEEGDWIVGRMAEGPIPYEMEPVPAGGKSHAGNPFKPTGRSAGHMSLDYRPLLQKGLKGIAEDFCSHAHTKEQKEYAALVERAAAAIGQYAERYALAAEAHGARRAAEALRIVPMNPAQDFFSAVQSVWLMEMILSCVTGGRDFAFSRLDLALLPFFDAAESEDAQEILTAFLLHCNNIGGMGSELHVHMPVPCAATNIYLMLGGRGAEEALALDLCFLRAALKVRLPQPVLALRQCKDSDSRWKIACAHAAQELNGQVSLYNDDALIPNLIALGMPEGKALHYTMSGCNRAETMGHQSSDAFDDCVRWFLNAFYDEKCLTPEDMVQALGREAERALATAVGNPRVPQEKELRFNLESLLLNDCAEKCCDIENGGLAMETYVHNLCGIATIADSLAAVEQLVMEEKRLSLEEFREIVRRNYRDQELLRLRIKKRAPKYGNDDDRADVWARRAGEVLAEAVGHQTGELIHIPSFYSLYFHQFQGAKLGATPDGRLAGEDVSENQSPVYGCDVKGATALLCSAAKLPQNRCGAGGLNLRLARKLADEQLAALVSAYFAMGGVNLAPSVLTKETLLAAREHPEQYQNLAVRIVGYSELYLRLPERMQIEILNRTEYAL